MMPKEKRRAVGPAALDFVVVQAGLFDGRRLSGRCPTAAAGLFLCRFGIVWNDCRQAQRRRQAISVDRNIVVCVLRRIGDRHSTARATTARTIGFFVAPGSGCSLDILIGLIALIDLRATRRAIGTVSRRGITLASATAAIGIARGVAITGAAIALMIAVLVTTIGPVTVTVAAFTLPVSLAVTLGTTITGIPAIRTVAPIAAVVPLAAIITSVVTAIIPPIALIGIDPVIGHTFDIAVEILVIAIFELVVRATARLTFFEARTRFGEHAEIMIGKLQIIFCIDPVALHLGVARQRLVFLEQLGRVAARPIINAIAVFGTTPGIATTLRALPATTATAAGLTIIDQVLLSSCLKFKTGVAP